MSININNIHKRFGHLEVLKGIDFTFNPGKITCILGPNGSGKTTLMKSILGLVIPDKGEISIEDKNALNNFHIRKKIAYVPQIARFPENLKVIELFKLVEEVRKEKGNPEPLIQLFNIESFLKKPLKTLSGGTRQKVNLVCALMFDCKVIIMDEPTSGLDPLSNIRLKNLIQGYKLQNKTILLTTHMLHLTESIADEVVFILDGKVNYSGPIKQLMSITKTSNLEAAIAVILETQQHV